MADRAHESARNSLSPEAKNAYLGMAKAWETMIEELERLLAQHEGSEEFTPDAIRSVAKRINPDR